MTDSFNRARRPGPHFPTLQIHDKSSCRFLQNLLQLEMTTMTKVRPSKHPASFFSQGSLILLPVLVLAVIGFYALRQDRRMIEADAKERAHQLATRWLQAISLEWSAAEANWTNRLQLLHSMSIEQRPRACFFEMDAQGRLLFPPAYPAVPEPQPLVAPAELNPDQARLWDAARIADVRAEQAGDVAIAWRQFLESQPPTRFTAAARFSLACVFARRGEIDSAVESFQSISRESPAELSEAGLPFEHLAYLRLFQL